MFVDKGETLSPRVVKPFATYCKTTLCCIH